MYFKVSLLLVALAYVNCLPISDDQTVDAGSNVEASAPGEEEIDNTSDGYKGTDTDNTSDGYKGTDTGIEENGTHMLSLMYAHKNDIALLMKFIEDGFNLRGGMDKISSGIDAKKQGYRDIFYRRSFKSGLEKTILGDEMVVRGMRQGGKALFNLAVDNVYAVALNELRDSGSDRQFLLDMN